MATKTNKKTTKTQPKTKKIKIFAGVAPKYRSPKDLQKKIDEYFISLTDGSSKLGKYPTLSGLTLFTGFATNHWMNDYQKKSKGFKHVVLCAKSRIENDINQMLLKPDTKNVQGPKFYLGAAYKYSEKVDTKLSGSTTQFIRYPQKKAPGSPILVRDKKSKKKVIGKNKVKTA